MHGQYRKVDSRFPAACDKGVWYISRGGPLCPSEQHHAAKRNPVSIEHSRSIASSAYGDALAAMNMIHNTPFGDIVDTEDDLQPHLYRAFSNAGRVMKLMYAVISTLKVNEEHTKKMAAKSSITITELADTLSRDYDISFRKAHSIASHIAKSRLLKGKSYMIGTHKKSTRSSMNSFQ